MQNAKSVFPAHALRGKKYRHFYGISNQREKNLLTFLATLAKNNCVRQLINWKFSNIKLQLFV